MKRIHRQAGGPGYGMFSIEDEAVIVVGSQRLLVIKRQRGPLLHGTAAQRRAKTQTKQQTTI